MGCFLLLFVISHRYFFVCHFVSFFCLNFHSGSNAINNGSSSCSKCVAGFYIPDGRANTICLSCPEGYYVSSPGSSICKECNPGFSQNSIAGTACVGCTRHFYSTSVDAAFGGACKACPLGYEQQSVNGVMCTVCPAGRQGVALDGVLPYGVDDEACSECGVGRCVGCCWLCVYILC